MPDCNTEDQNKLINHARSLMVTYEDMVELIRLGAYRRGSNAVVDEAIHYHECWKVFWRKARMKLYAGQSYDLLASIFGEQSS